jgi:hypothetical protein
MSDILIRYFPKSKQLKKMKDITNLDINSSWYEISQTGTIYLDYSYLGLDVKFGARIIYKKNKYIEEYELFSKFNNNNDYLDIHVNTFDKEDIPSFKVIKEIFKYYKLKTIIYRTFYGYSL